MEVAAIQGAVFVIEEAIKLEPALVAEFQNLFAKGTPTPEEFQVFRDKVAGESYAKFVPDSALKPDVAAQ